MRGPGPPAVCFSSSPIPATLARFLLAEIELLQVGIQFDKRRADPIVERCNIGCHDAVMIMDSIKAFFLMRMTRRCLLYILLSVAAGVVLARVGMSDSAAAVAPDSRDGGNGHAGRRRCARASAGSRLSRARTDAQPGESRPPSRSPTPAPRLFRAITTSRPLSLQQCSGVDGAFLVTDWWEHGVDVEIRHGRMLVDKAEDAGSLARGIHVRGQC